MPTPALYHPDLEIIRQDEAQTIEYIAEAMQHILDTTYLHYGHPVRAVHAKAHGILQATVSVRDGLPAYLAQGVFAGAKTYSAIIAFPPFRGIYSMTPCLHRGGWP